MQAEAGTSLTAIDPVPPRVRAPHLMAAVLLVGAAVWAFDRVTKLWALEALVPGRPVEAVGSLLRFTLLFNSGAAFSLGTGVTPVFTVLQAAVVVAVLVASVRVGSRLWAAGMGLVLGGAAGNLADRLTRPPGFGRGEVVDFLQLPNWPVFNVADSAICVAAALVAFAAWRGIGFDGRREVSSSKDVRAQDSPETDGVHRG